MSQCERIRDELKAYADGELSFLQRGKVRFHLSRCASCREEVTAMQRLGRELRAGDAGGLDPSLRARILAAFPEGVPAPSAEAARPARRPLRLAETFALVGATAALALFLIPVFRRPQAAPYAAPLTTSDDKMSKSAAAPSAPSANNGKAASAMSKSDNAGAGPAYQEMEARRQERSSADDTAGVKKPLPTIVGKAAAPPPLGASEENSVIIAEAKPSVTAPQREMQAALGKDSKAASIPSPQDADENKKASPGSAFGGGSKRGSSGGSGSFGQAIHPSGGQEQVRAANGLKMKAKQETPKEKSALPVKLSVTPATKPAEVSRRNTTLTAKPSLNVNMALLEWQDAPANQRIAVTNVRFDRNGYRISAVNGENYVVPFVNHDLFAVKFGRSQELASYFVREADAPTLYINQRLTLQSATGARWRPLPGSYAPPHPLYISPAPDWNALTQKNWPAELFYEGGKAQEQRGGPVFWTPGYTLRLGEKQFASFADYDAYARPPAARRNSASSRAPGSAAGAKGSSKK